MERHMVSFMHAALIIFMYLRTFLSMVVKHNGAALHFFFNICTIDSLPFCSWVDLCQLQWYLDDCRVVLLCPGWQKSAQSLLERCLSLLQFAVPHMKICQLRVKRSRQCPQIRQQYGKNNKAAIALQCKSNVKLIAALLLIPYSRLNWWDSWEYSL